MSVTAVASWLRWRGYSLCDWFSY